MINLSYTEGRIRAAAAVPKSSPTLSHRLPPVSFFVSLLVTSFFCNTEQGHLEHRQQFHFLSQNGEKTRPEKCVCVTATRGWCDISRHEN